MIDGKLIGLLSKLKVVPEKTRRHRSSGPGAHLSKGLGQSMDFSEFRPYQPGDDLRALDWKVYGRTDRLYTKLYVPEQEETVCFLLDTSGSMKSKWQAVQTVVMGLSNVVLGQGDRVAALLLANPATDQVQGLPAARGRSALARISKFLTQFDPVGVTPLEEAFRQASQRLKSRCHLVIISDFLQPGAGVSGLSQLRYRKHRLTLIQLLAPEERDPTGSMSPGEWELFDPEPGEGAASLRLDLGQSSFTRYQEALQRHNHALKEFCRKSDAVFVSSDTDFEPSAFFSEELRKAGLLS